MTISEAEYVSWDKLIYDLNGTCTGLFTFLEQQERSDLEDYIPFLLYLDSSIFNCADCGWWFDISEQAESDDMEARCLSCDEENP